MTMVARTLFAVLSQSCGLSHREAADYLRVRIDTVTSWSIGRRAPPERVLGELAALVTRIDTAAAEQLAQIERLSAEHGRPAEIDLGIASDDAEAQAIGWPCVGAQAASLGRLIARGMERGYRFRLSPRGATVAAHDVNTTTLDP